MKLKNDKSGNSNKTALIGIKNIVTLGYVYESIFSSYFLNNSCHFLIAIPAY